MEKQLELVRKFHEKFRIPILEKPTLVSKSRSDLRYSLMKEEIEEYLNGATKEDIENIAKELADILYTVYGTILEHGLQDKMEAVFEEVHRSNMSKEHGELKIKKGIHYVEPDVKKIFS